MTIDDILKKVQNEHIRTVIFDFDNTICDLIIDWEDWYKHLVRIFQKYEPDFEGPFDEGIENVTQNSFMKKYGDRLRNELISYNLDYERKYVQGFVPLSKTVELIQRMHDVSIWVWSLNSKETIDKSLQQLGIEEKFTEFITRENAQYLKPDPTGFFITAGTNAKKDEFLMIGNSDSDRGAALAAGIQYIDVSEIEEID